MLNALPIIRIRPSGFSLVELMIGIAIVGVLLGAAVPSFRAWIQNAQIRNAAESIANGLQKARAEAVARNTNVAFILGAGTDSSWVVSVVTPASAIESRPSTEGSKNVTRTEVPVGATTITFNNFGTVVPNVPASSSLTQVDLLAVGGDKTLRVTIGAGGSTKMCDPSLVAGSGPRAC